MFNPWYSVFITFGSGLILLFLSYQVYKSKRIVGSSIFWIVLFLYALICLIFSINSLGHIIPGIGPYPWSLHLYWVYYTCFYILPVAWLLYCMQYSGNSEYIKKPIVCILLIVPFFFSYIRIEEFWAPFSFLVNEIYTPAFAEFFHLFAYLYLYCLILIGDMFLLRRYPNVSKKFRPQILFLIAGTSIPFVFEIISDGNFLPSGMDMAISGFFLAFGVLYYDMLAHPPIFREKFFELADSGLFVLNEERKILDLNPVAESLLKTSLQEAFGKIPSDISTIPHELRSVLEHPFITDPQPHFSISGSPIRWFRISAHWFPHIIGAEGVFLITITDITKNINLEKEVSRYALKQLKKRESAERDQKYLDFIRASRDAVLILSGNRITACNEAARQLFGMPQEELVGMNPVALSSPVQEKDDDVPEKLEYLIISAATGQITTIPWIFTTQDRLIHAEVTLRQYTYQFSDIVEMTIRTESGYT